MAFSVKGKVAIVTGAGSGINLSFAVTLLEKGCNVVMADLKLLPEAKELLDTHSTLREGRRAIFQKTDVSKWRDLTILFKKTVEEFGAVDIVVPGAGIYEPIYSNFWHPPGSPDSVDEEEKGGYLVMDVNLIHPIRMTQLAIQYFVKNKRQGSIVHISSIAGQASELTTPLYVASKHALNGFVRSLCTLESVFNIRVTAVAPGVIKTPIWTEDKLVMVTGDDEWVLPEEVAAAMLALIENDVFNGIKMEGGLILEVSKNKVRKVEEFNDPGPSGPGNTVGNLEGVYNGVYDTLRSWQ